MFIYVGCRTTRERNARGNGINVYRIDAQTGRLSHVQLVDGLVNPSFLALDRQQDFLYCVHGDTDVVPWDIGAFASHTTYMGGRAAQMAAEKVKEQVKARAAHKRDWDNAARFLRLLRRVRVLLIAIAILFAWFTPGEAFFHDWPRLGPTREGLALAVLHAARLVAVVCAVAVLLERLSLQRLVSGLHALSRPLRPIGVSPERLALRLFQVVPAITPPPVRWPPGSVCRPWCRACRRSSRSKAAHVRSVWPRPPGR